MIPQSLKREFNNNKFEKTESGLYFPKAGLHLKGQYHTWIDKANGETTPIEYHDNIIVNEGMNKMLNVMFNGSAQVTTWYIGLGKNASYSEVLTETAASVASNATEATTEYDESTRVEFVEAASSSKSTSNTGNEATFTANTTVSMYLAFLVSVATKGATTGTLFSIANFNAVKNLVDDDVLNVGYTITIADDSE